MIGVKPPTMFRVLLMIGAADILSACAATPPGASSADPSPIKTEHLVVQWETGIAASGFWAADGRDLEQGEVPQIMVKFQNKQPVRPGGWRTQVAYYEIEGYVVPLRYRDAPEGKVHYVLHVTRVERMEPAHPDLPPLGRNQH